MHLHLEAVSVCLHYDDFLEQTIRVNQSLFDDWVVVTAKEDQATRDVCTRYGVRIAPVRTSSGAVSRSPRP